VAQRALQNWARPVLRVVVGNVAVVGNVDVVEVEVAGAAAATLVGFAIAPSVPVPRRAIIDNSESVRIRIRVHFRRFPLGGGRIA